MSVAMHRWWRSRLPGDGGDALERGGVCHEGGGFEDFDFVAVVHAITIGIGEVGAGGGFALGDV